MLVRHSEGFAVAVAVTEPPACMLRKFVAIKDHCITVLTCFACYQQTLLLLISCLASCFLTECLMTA